jgi:AraC family transcriptional regulator of adaptative response/methylated-DNA-[protein]-cysteine methyltransferase
VRPTHDPTPAEQPDDDRWAAVFTRDAAADGEFVYAVATTGVYCRPSCAARTPRRENVTFYGSPADAESAGFRACKRCRPSGPSRTQRESAIVADLCRAVEDAEQPPSLAELAERAGLSESYVHRMFTRVTGVTPKRYAAEVRARRVRDALGAGEPVADAAFGAGFGSSSRFYEKSEELLGMQPAQYRAGGTGAQITFAVGECSLGSVLVASSERGVCAILLGDDPADLVADLERRFPNAELLGGDEGFEDLVARVVGLVEQPCVGCDLPLDIRGTAFQQRVWSALREIPAGETASYREVAERIGSPSATRAVAAACAANHIAVAIPCHRVVRIDRGLSGYRWGIERKRVLLERETACAAEAGGPS